MRTVSQIEADIQRLITLRDLLAAKTEQLVPILMERGRITEAKAREVIRGAIAQLETLIYHSRQLIYYIELGVEMKEESDRLQREHERLLRETEELLGEKSPGVGWGWIVGVGLGILFLMGRSAKKPEPEAKKKALEP